MTKSTWGIFLFCVFLSGCSSVARRRTSLFDAAVSKLLLTSFATAQPQFEQACEQGASAACFALGRSVQVVPRLSILQGMTTAHDTQLSVIVPVQRHFEYFLWDVAEQKIVPGANVLHMRDDSEWGVMQLFYRGLQLGKIYRFDVVREGQIVDSRKLATLDLKQRSATIAIVSGLNGNSPGDDLFQSLALQKPDLIFLLGNCADINAGVGTPVVPARIWRRQIEARQALNLYHQSRLIPMLATWNDRDYGVTSGDRRNPQRPEVREIFQDLFAQRPDPPYLVSGPGISLKMSAFHQKFLLLDNRSFRSPDGQIVIGQTHFGDRQERWIFHQFSRSPVWLLSGDEFFAGNLPNETYQDSQAISFPVFLNELRTLPQPAIFISGSQSGAELLNVTAKDIGYRTFELTAGPIHAQLESGPLRMVSHRTNLAMKPGTENFAILQIRSQSRGVAVDVVDMGSGSHIWFEKKLRVNK